MKSYIIFAIIGLIIVGLVITKYMREPPKPYVIGPLTQTCKNYAQSLVKQQPTSTDASILNANLSNALDCALQYITSTFLSNSTYKTISAGTNNIKCYNGLDGSGTQFSMINDFEVMVTCINNVMITYDDLIRSNNSFTSSNTSKFKTLTELMTRLGLVYIKDSIGMIIQFAPMSGNAILTRVTTPSGNLPEALNLPSNIMSCINVCYANNTNFQVDSQESSKLYPTDAIYDASTNSCSCITSSQNLSLFTNGLPKCQ